MRIIHLLYTEDSGDLLGLGDDNKVYIYIWSTETADWQLYKDEE